MSARRPEGEGSPLVAVLARRGRFLVAEPLFERGRRIALDPRALRDQTSRRGRRPGSSRSPAASPRAGDLVLVQSAAARRGAARVLARIGRPDVAADVIEALMLDRGLRRRFDPAVEHEARAARDQAASSRRGEASRRDLRDLATFTIDPASARDFDDAISAQRLDDGQARVWVHIADVSAFVREGSLLDREARRRATSVYVPGAVEPMLPEALSNQACSLMPGQDRLAVTVEFDLDGARVTRRAFYRSLIRSDARLDYEQVDRIFAGRERAAGPWAAPLAVARDAARALGEWRAQRGALVVSTPEPEFGFDAGGGVVDMDDRPSTESHALIEQLMVSANEQVAGLLAERRVPTLYRVHERPEPTSVRTLADALASLDVPTPPLADHLSPQQAADAVAEISRVVDRHVLRQGHGRVGLTTLILRALQQAYYSPTNVGHAGLHSSAYCHFTSPIRRYPDVVCHRALLAAVGSDEQAPSARELPRLGEWTSAREREAMVIERDADDVARCFLLQRRLVELGPDASFDGEVVGLVGSGLFVRFGEGFEGMLPLRRLPGDWWELNQFGTAVEGAHSGRVLRLGDRQRVAVDRVDPPRGRVDLIPA